MGWMQKRDRVNRRERSGVEEGEGVGDLHRSCFELGQQFESDAGMGGRQTDKPFICTEIDFRRTGYWTAISVGSSCSRSARLSESLNCKTDGVSRHLLPYEKFLELARQNPLGRREFTLINSRRPFPLSGWRFLELREFETAIAQCCQEMPHAEVQWIRGRGWGKSEERKVCGLRSLEPTLWEPRVGHPQVQLIGGAKSEIYRPDAG